jgi:hypothetical protein
MSSDPGLNYTRGHTKIIDSDFRAGAILYSMTNALLFSFSIVCTLVFIQLSKKTSISVGVNVLAMTVISVVVAIISAVLFIYSLYKLILTKEYRDHIVNQLVQPSGAIGYTPKVTDIRDVPFQQFDQGDVGGGVKRNIPIQRGLENDTIDLSSVGIV